MCAVQPVNTSLNWFWIKEYTNKEHKQQKLDDSTCKAHAMGECGGGVPVWCGLACGLPAGPGTRWDATSPLPRGGASSFFAPLRLSLSLSLSPASLSLLL